MLLEHNNFFIVGIKGAAMANLALILKKIGKNVTGSDINEEFITDNVLKENNISFTAGFSATDLPKATDLIVYSAAHQGTSNPQVREAEKRGIPIVSQARIIGELMSQFKTKVAVAGCHGKTTTASLLAYSLIKLGKKPSYIVGAPSFNKYYGGDWEPGKYFVAEADEYGVDPPQDKTPKFNFLNPDYILCPNIDFDHPDVYQNIGEVKQAFMKFFDSKKLILCADDPILLQCLRTSKFKDCLTYGYSSEADYQIKKSKIERDFSIFELFRESKCLAKFRLSLFGEKNISNAAGVIVLLLKLGFKAEEIAFAIKDFTGAKRRFEKVFYGNDIYLFDDYGHHPAEIAATISAARTRFPKRRVIVIFQPHTYSRTLSFLSDFAGSLSTADKTFILPIFASAREKSSDFHISSLDIVKLNPNKLTFISSKGQLFKLLLSILKPHDIIFTLGAGDVYKLKDDIINIINEFNSEN